MTLLNELEDVRTYLVNEDTFFYSMVYDPNQKTLLVDKGEIRVGADYQAEVPSYIPPGGSTPALSWSTKIVPLCLRISRGAISLGHQGLGAKQDA